MIEPVSASARLDATWMVHEILPPGLVEAGSRGMTLGALGGHAVRVAALVRLVAMRLGMGERDANDIGVAAAFHDIGKTFVSRSLLWHVGPLTPFERKVVESHTTLGEELLRTSRTAKLRRAAVIARSHHENLDGSGYPDGRADDEIPLSARITRVADVLDSYTSPRVYRKTTWSEDDVVHHLITEKHVLFDSDVVDALVDALRSHPGLLSRLRAFTDSGRSQLEATRQTMFDWSDTIG